MSPTESGKSEVFLPCTPNDASASEASAVTHPHDQIHQEIDECALTGAPQCTPEDAFTLMELSDVVGGNAVPDGDHLAGPCDMDGGMDGDLLEGDDVLGASWDACDHTGNLEAILRSSYQPAKQSQSLSRLKKSFESTQSGSATGQHLAQSSIAGILSHIHASAAYAATADAGKLLWEGPAAVFEDERRRGEGEFEERRGEGDGENAKLAKFAAVAEATKRGGTERARDTVDTYCANTVCDTVLRSPSPPRGSIPQRLSLLQVS
ncbi:unnamed protein product [Closterium sp. NIES-54]